MQRLYMLSAFYFIICTSFGQTCLQLPPFEDDNGMLAFGFWQGHSGAEEYDTYERDIQYGCTKNISSASPSGGGFLGCDIGSNRDEGVYGILEGLELSEEYCFAFYWANLYCERDEGDRCVDLRIIVEEEEHVFSCARDWTYIEVCFVATKEEMRIDISGIPVSESGYYIVDNAIACECEVKSRLNLTLPDSVGLPEGTPLVLDPDLTGIELDSFYWESTTGYSNHSDLIFDEVIYMDQVLELTLYYESCEITYSIVVNVLDEDNLYLGNAFNPNSSFNGVFYIQGAPDADIFIESFSVYDRWGSRVFQSEHFYPNDRRMGWNGMIDGGEASTGVYVYVVHYRVNGGSRIKKGDVTLLR